MKSLTVLQPYASAIALGAKRIETRSWATRYRGPIAIHAAKRQRIRDLKAFHETPIGEAVFWKLTPASWPDHRPLRFWLPFGTFVAVANLVDCKRVEDLDEGELDRAKQHSGRRCWMHAFSPGCKAHDEDGDPRECLLGEPYWTERDLGNYAPGRYGWILDNVRALPEPIPYRGRQGLWTVPEGVF